MKMVSYCRSAFGFAPASGSAVLVQYCTLPSAYPSLRFPPQQANIALAGGPGVAQLGNALGYYLPRLAALDSRGGKTFVPPGGIFQKPARKGRRDTRR